MPFEVYVYSPADAGLSEPLNVPSELPGEFVALLYKLTNRFPEVFVVGPKGKVALVSVHA